jgi:hypothetical protein
MVGTRSRWLLFFFAVLEFPALALAQDWQRSSFDETVKFIDGKLSQVEKNKMVAHRFTAPTICVAHWGNDSIRTELKLSSIERIGTDTGTEASVICSPEPGSGGRQASQCITVQYRADSGWLPFREARFARFSAGSLEDSAQVQQALSHLIAMCGGGR